MEFLGIFQMPTENQPWNFDFLGFSIEKSHLNYFKLIETIKNSMEKKMSRNFEKKFKTFKYLKKYERENRTFPNRTWNRKLYRDAFGTNEKPLNSLQIQNLFFKFLSFASFDKNLL